MKRRIIEALKTLIALGIFIPMVVAMILPELVFKELRGKKVPDDIPKN